MSTLSDGKTETKISASSGYWDLDAANARLANEKAIELLEHYMKEFNIEFTDLIDFMYNLHAVVNHGFGKIETNVFEGKITKVQATITTLRGAVVEKVLQDKIST